MLRVSQSASFTSSTLFAATLCAFGCAHNAQSGGHDRPTYSISKKVAEDFQEVGEHAKKKEWDVALHKLDKMEQRSNLNPYEQAAIWKARAGVYFVQNDIEKSTAAQQKAVAFDAMPEDEQLEAEYNLALGYFMLERFNDSADSFGKWATHAKEVTPEQAFVVASAYSQARRFAEALPFAKKAVDADPQPKEAWLKLLLSLQFELDHDAEVAAVLERLVKSFPKPEYWLQLAAAYQAVGNAPKAVTTLEAARAKGALTAEKDLVNLARLYMQAGAPEKGAALLDEQMAAGKIKKTPETLELVAACWIASKNAERGEAAVKAAGENISGEAWLALARLNGEKGDWAKARDDTASAITHGGLRSPGSAHLLLGVAHYNTKRKDAALASLGEAKRYPDSAGCADQWIKLVKAGKGTPPNCGLAAGGGATASAAKTASD
jgi:tetratricopeptide (TPR) repeat protein